MSRKTKLGPIGSGWIEIRKNNWIAVWKENIADPQAPNGVRTIHGGQHVLGQLHQLGKKKGRDYTEKEITEAREVERSLVRSEWEKIAYDVMHKTPTTSRPERPRIEGITSADPTFGELLHFGYVAKKRDLWKESTKESVEGTYVPKLMAQFGDVPISRITQSDIENWLFYLAVKGKDPEKHIGYSKTILQHCRDYVTAVTAIAFQHGFIPNDPGKDVALPNGIRPELHRHLRLSDFIKLAVELPTPKDELMAELLYFAGFRCGELFAVRWSAFHGPSLKVQSQLNSRGKKAKESGELDAINGQSVRVVSQIDRRGEEANPKKNRQDPANQERDANYIVLPEALLQKIREYKRWCGKVGPNDFIFPSRAGTPIGRKNWITRTVKPAAARAGLLHIDYHSFRRGIATKMFNHLQREGIQKVGEHLRHSSADVTRRYIVADEEGDAAHEELMDKLYANYLQDRAAFEDSHEQYEWVRVRVKKASQSK